MTGRRDGTVAIRTGLAQCTRSLHEALHQDPVLSRLNAKDITRAEYMTALMVFFYFFHSVERARQRLECWPQFSLLRECKALSIDLNRPPEWTGALNFASETEMLGGLYVAHGAMFGRSVFRQSVRTALPDAPNRFVSLKTAPGVWQALVFALEGTGGSTHRKSELAAGAAAGFGAVRKLLQKASQGN